LVNLTLVFDQVVSPSRSGTDGVNVNYSWGHRRSDIHKSGFSPTSTARGGLTTLESATGGEVALLPVAPQGGIAVRASSTSDSPTTLGSADLVREGEVGAPWSCCGSATDLHNNATSKTYPHKHGSNKQKRSSAQDFLPRDNRNVGLRPKKPMANRCRQLGLHCGSSSLRLQTTTEGILRRLLHQLPLPLGSRAF
jgi:hypothetical protein